MIDQIWVAIALMKACARAEMFEQENTALRAEIEKLKAVPPPEEKEHA